MKKILITGGTGFLGSHLVKRLLKDNHRVILLKRSTSNTSRIKDCRGSLVSYDIDLISLDEITDDKIDIIVHCATNYGRAEIEPGGIIEANLILPLKLLLFGNRRGIPCFINTDTILDKRINHYSLSKSQFREWLKAYSKNLTCINIALEHFYGPNDDKSKFVAFIIEKIINSAEKIDLTEGKQKRDFIYIDDTIDAFTKIIDYCGELKEGFFNYEIGTGNPVEIRELVELIKNIAGNESTVLNFGAVPYREREVMEYKVDLSEIRKLGWKPEFSLRDGLTRTIEHERANIL